MTLTARETTSGRGWTLKRIAVEVCALLFSLVVAVLGGVFTGVVLIAPILFLLILAFCYWLSRAWFYDAIIGPKNIGSPEQFETGGPDNDDSLRTR